MRTLGYHNPQKGMNKKSWSMRSTQHGTPHSFPSMSEAPSALFISHPCIQFWTLHFCFDNFVFFAHVLTINLPETFRVNPNPKSLVCVVFVTYSSGFLPVIVYLGNECVKKNIWGLLIPSSRHDQFEA
jgi:hypothetical protein